MKNFGEDCHIDEKSVSFEADEPAIMSFECPIAKEEFFKVYKPCFPVEDKIVKETVVGGPVVDKSSKSYGKQQSEKNLKRKRDEKSEEEATDNESEEFVLKLHKLNPKRQRLEKRLENLYDETSGSESDETDVEQPKKNLKRRRDESLKEEAIDSESDASDESDVEEHKENHKRKREESADEESSKNHKRRRDETSQEATPKSSSNVSVVSEPNTNRADSASSHSTPPATEPKKNKRCVYTNPDKDTLFVTFPHYCLDLVYEIFEDLVYQPDNVEGETRTPAQNKEDFDSSWTKTKVDLALAFWNAQNRAPPNVKPRWIASHMVRTDGILRGL